MNQYMFMCRDCHNRQKKRQKKTKKDTLTQKMSGVHRYVLNHEAIHSCVL